MNALRIILSALLIGGAGWMMFDHALEQKFYDLKISHELKASRRLDDWQRRQDLYKEWESFAQEHHLTWQLNERTSWSLSGPASTKNNIEHFVSSWNSKEKERVQILAEDIKKESQKTLIKKAELIQELSWTDQKINNIEATLEKRSLPHTEEVVAIEPEQVIETPLEETPEVALDSTENAEPDAESQLKSDEMADMDQDLESDLDAEPETLSDLFTDLLLLGSDEPNISGNDTFVSGNHALAYSDNVLVSSDNVSLSANNLLMSDDKLGSSKNVFVTDTLKPTESPVVDDSILSTNDNTIFGLDSIIGAINDATASINVQLGSSQEQTSLQAHALKEELNRLTQQQQDLSAQQMKLATLSMDLQHQQFEDLTRRKIELWIESQQEKISQLQHRRDTLLNQISSFESINQPQPLPHELKLKLQKENIELPFTEIKHSYRFLLIGFALCFLLNLFWEMALYRREL